MNLGILGGTFNPIHLAHLRLGEEAREALALDRVLFVVAGDPPLKQAGIAPGRQRLAMVESAIATNPAFEACDLELRRAGPSYTVHTLEALAEAHPGARLWFLVGADTLGDLERWHRPERLFELASLAVATRPGYAGSPVERLPARLAAGFQAAGERGAWQHASGNELRAIAFTPLQISATEIRRRVAARRSIRYLTPDEVIEDIRKYRLYEAEPADDGEPDQGGPAR